MTIWTATIVALASGKLELSRFADFLLTAIPVMML
jgi:hypothetical protein